MQFKPPLCDNKAKGGDEVFVHYRGTLLDGKQFDSSYDRGDPLNFTLGQGQVIQGWEQVRSVTVLTSIQPCHLPCL